MVRTRSSSRSDPTFMLESLDSVGSGGRRCSGEGKRLRHQKHYGGDWADMGAELLEYIQKKLPWSDILKCRAVCRWWRSVTKTHLASLLNYLLKPSPSPSPSPSPPLILWDKNLIPTKSEQWCFLNILRTDGRRNLYFPNPQSKQLLGEMGRCVGSSSDAGYLLFMDKEEEKSLFLFHPMLFSGSAIRLPVPTIPPSPQKKFADGYAFLIHRVILWANPISGTSGSGGLLVMHPTHKPPLFAKCGATQFTPLECRDPNNEELTKFVSVICVKNSIYGITELGLDYFNAWDCTNSISSSSIPRLVMEFKPEFSPSPPSYRLSLHLVESQGDILLVGIDTPPKRLIKATGGTIAEYNKVYPMCEVYKMDFDNKEWVRINSLGDRVLFVTEFQSTSLSSHEFPQYQRNSIYFYGRLLVRNTQPFFGIFNMEDGSIKVIYAKK